MLIFMISQSTLRFPPFVQIFAYLFIFVLITDIEGEAFEREREIMEVFINLRKFTPMLRRPLEVYLEPSIDLSMIIHLH